MPYVRASRQTTEIWAHSVALREYVLRLDYFYDSTQQKHNVSPSVKLVDPWLHRVSVPPHSSRIRRGLAEKESGRQSSQGPGEVHLKFDKMAPVSFGFEEGSCSFSVVCDGMSSEDIAHVTNCALL